MTGVGARVVPARSEALWFLGTVARIKLDGNDTGGRFALIDLLAPHGAAPPLHSHLQDETFTVLEGELTTWVLPDADVASDPGWADRYACTCLPGSVVFAPARVPHTFRVESDTARLLVLSTPAGIEEYMRFLGEPARWPWLQPPADGPRVPVERITAVEAELGIIRHGPPPARSVSPR